MTPTHPEPTPPARRAPGRPPGARDKQPRRITPRDARRRAAAILARMTEGRMGKPDPALQPYLPTKDRQPAPCRLSRAHVTQLHVLLRHWTEGPADESPTRPSGHAPMLIDVMDAVLTAGLAALMPCPDATGTDLHPALASAGDEA